MSPLGSCSGPAPPLTPPRSPPKSSLQRRLEMTTPPVGGLATPITVYKEPERVQRMKRGLSVEDQKLVDRLEALRKK